MRSSGELNLVRGAGWGNDCIWRDEGGLTDTSTFQRLMVARISGVLGVVVLAAMAGVAMSDNQQADDAAMRQSAVSSTPGQRTWRDWLMDPSRAAGPYFGIAHTHPATVSISKSGEEVTVKDFDWIGRPFVAPIYYGARIWRWPGFGRGGTMVDFTHAKAIANPDTVATFTGSHNGEALPNRAPVKDVFSKLEFSHGHNMLTYNGLLRLGQFFGRVRPYVGAGAGVSLPHTEIGYAKDNIRTYEYQFAGFAGQALAGIEIDLGRTSIILEYKFTYAPYDVPVSHEPEGDLLVTDLWRQFNAWWRGETPPGGRLTTTLASHHGYAGFMVKAGSPTAREVAGP